MFGVLGFRVLGFRESRVQDAKGFRESRVSGFQGLGRSLQRPQPKLLQPLRLRRWPQSRRFAEFSNII